MPRGDLPGPTPITTSPTEECRDAQIVSENYEFVVGVDTHAATHTFALLAAATGAVLEHAVFATSGAGLTRAHAWLTQHGYLAAVDAVLFEPLVQAAGADAQLVGDLLHLLA